MQRAASVRLQRKLGYYEQQPAPRSNAVSSGRNRRDKNNRAGSSCKGRKECSFDEPEKMCNRKE